MSCSCQVLVLLDHAVLEQYSLNAFDCSGRRFARYASSSPSWKPPFKKACDALSILEAQPYAGEQTDAFGGAKQGASPYPEHHVAAHSSMHTDNSLPIITNHTLSLHYLKTSWRNCDSSLLNVYSVHVET